MSDVEEMAIPIVTRLPIDPPADGPEQLGAHCPVCAWEFHMPTDTEDAAEVECPNPFTAAHSMSIERTISEVTAHVIE